MNKDNNSLTDTLTADIPAHRALKADRQWQTIQHAQLTEKLTEFRVGVEAKTGIGIANIKTNLGLALANVAEALGIKEPDNLLRILGGGTYSSIYKDPIPYRPDHADSTSQATRRLALEAHEQL